MLIIQIYNTYYKYLINSLFLLDTTKSNVRVPDAIASKQSQFTVEIC